MAQTHSPLLGSSPSRRTPGRGPRKQVAQPHGLNDLPAEARLAAVELGAPSCASPTQV